LIVISPEGKKGKKDVEEEEEEDREAIRMGQKGFVRGAFSL
jgi:hypothetical protein